MPIFCLAGAGAEGAWQRWRGESIEHGCIQLSINTGAASNNSQKWGETSVCTVYSKGMVIDEYLPFYIFPKIYVK